MKNKITHISREDFNNLSNKSNDKSYTVILDGKEMKNTDSFFEKISSAFQFRINNGTWGKNWAAFDDMMTDLSWIKDDNITLFIKSYNALLSENPEDKNRFIRYFQNSILPFWEYEVCEVVFEGKPKVFNVYLVD